MNKTGLLRVLVVIVVMLIAVSGCSPALQSASPETGGADAESVMMAATATRSADSSGTMAAQVSGGADAESATMRATSAPSTASSGVVSAPVSDISAGEIDDNARWDTYLNYRDEYLGRNRNSIHNVDVSARQIIQVSDAANLPVAGATVLTFAGDTLVSETQTYATGQTLFFPNARPESREAKSFRIVVQKGDSAVEFTLDAQGQSTARVMLDAATQQTQNTPLDVLFLLDATGSMSDEIAQLQNNILEISAQITARANTTDVHYGLVSYRDRGDEYVTKVYDFTPDVGTFQQQLNGVRAGGGGDTPEALNEALHEAVQGVTWRGDDTVKLIFLVADAAPHLDYANDSDYAQEMAIAAGKGIKIHPLASSGLTPDGEFIFRQIAQYTMGHFLFLTYDQGTSGASGDKRTDLEVGDPINPQTQQGDYTVEQLDDLVLQLITDEVAALTVPVAGQPNIQAKSIQPLQPMAIPLPEIERPTNIRVIESIPFRGDMPESGFNLNLIFIGAIIAAIILCMAVGYSLKARQSTYWEKRKNDQLSIEIDA
jgi:hypothetical protein